MDIVLASASPRRKEILSLLFGNFRVIPSFVPEDGLNLDPSELTVELARRKASQVFEENPGSLVIGADTVVVCDGKIMGKPGSYDHAVEMLQQLSGRTHSVITGVACISSSFRFSFHEGTEVAFRKMSAKEIEWYVQTDEPFDKAGAYAIQGDASIFVERIRGNYLNVVGFPLSSFYNRLRETCPDFTQSPNF
ncbi:MAG: septum formation protein Maf [Acidobacteria bacterium]|nr:septum formation protein Maf [Acidobacteriota bacterium]